MYIRTREANAMWSLFFAAAVTGLVVLGQRWQQERWQVLQLKWQSSISSEVNDLKTCVNNHYKMVIAIHLK